MNTQTRSKMTTGHEAAGIFRKAMNVFFLASLMAVSGTSHAKAHPATQCRMPVSDLSVKGQPLSYETLGQHKDAHKVASTGVIYAPVTLPNGRTAIYAVEPNGCARKTSLRVGLR